MQEFELQGKPIWGPKSKDGSRTISELDLELIQRRCLDAVMQISVVRQFPRQTSFRDLIGTKLCCGDILRVNIDDDNGGYRYVISMAVSSNVKDRP